MRDIQISSKPIKLLSIVTIAVMTLAAAYAQNASVQYFYDDLGRLVRVVDQNGNSATYSYDAVGNLVSITRGTVPANNGLAIFSFSPQRGFPGQSVTIQGQGFSTTPSANTVQFNGVTAIVSSSTANSLVVTVPSGATTGPISVSVAGATATSDLNFTVAAVALVSITVTPSTTSLAGGANQQFSAQGSFVDGSTQDITNSVSWSSSNTSVAAVGNAAGTQGAVTAVATGRARIIATSGGLTASGLLIVNSFQGITVIPSTASVLEGTTQQFTVTALLSDGSALDVTGSAVWGSSNSGVATVSNAPGSQGLATAVGNGATTITAAYGGVTSSIPLNVISLASIAVTPSNPLMPKGTTQQFSAKGTYTDGSTKDLTEIAGWSSSNSSVARVTGALGNFGFATAANQGTTTISALYGGITGSTNVTVTQPVADSITVTPVAPLLPPTGTVQLKAVARFSDGTTGDVTSMATWNSSNMGTATVSSTGFVTGVADGNANITATLGNASGSSSLTVTSSQIYQGYVYAGDGQTPAVGSPHSFNRHSVSIYDAATGSLLATAGTDSNGFYQTSGNPPSGQNVIVTTQMIECSYDTVSFRGTAAAGAPIVVNLTLPLAVVTGQVSFYDGTPAAFADIFLTSDHGCYGEASFSEVATADANGNYHAIAELQVGTFTVFGEDFSSGLISSAPGTVTSLASPVTVDVQLPPTGTVSGSVFDVNGNPVTQGTVRLYTSVGLQDTVKRQTLSGNNYQFTQVPVGTVVITASASDNVTPPVFAPGAATGLLPGAGQTLNLNVNLLPTSAVAGTVFASDGVTPVSSATVTVENAAMAGGIADFYSTPVLTDSSGNFSISNVPLGTVRVIANAPNSTNSGVVSGTLVQGATITLNPIIGNAVSPGLDISNLYKLSDANGFIYDLDCAGEPTFGGYPGSVGHVAYDGAAVPYVNNAFVPYFCEDNDAALLDQAGRQLIYGPRPMPGSPDSGSSSVLNVGRKVFVPQSGGFARYLEILNNPLNVPITATMEVDNYLETAFPTLAADPSQNGNTYAVVVDTSEPSHETLGFVMGSGNLVETTSGLSLFEEAFSYKWMVTVPANQTVILMHFLIQRLPGDTTGASSQAAVLADETDPNEFVGMTPTEISEVANFGTAQYLNTVGVNGQPPTAGTVSGAVTYANGNPVPYPTVSLQASDGTVLSDSTDLLGDFSFIGVPPGTFTVTASDPASQASGTNSGTLANAGGSASLNVVLGSSPAISGVLKGSVDGTVTAVNLTQPTALDWVHWGTSADQPLVRKTGVNPLIPDFTVVGNNAAQLFNDGEIEYLWADGTPLQSGVRTTTGELVPGQGNGFHLSVPATTKTETLWLYVGTYRGKAQLTASLSDQSAAPYQDNSLDDFLQTVANGTYKIDFRASQPGQTLNVDFVLQSDYNSGNVTLQSAVLAPHLPEVSIDSPSASDYFNNFDVGGSFLAQVSASQIDSPIGSVALMLDSQNVGRLNSPPYDFQVNGLGAGDHVLTAVATDGEGLVGTSAPVLVTGQASSGWYLIGNATTFSNVDISAGSSDWIHWGTVNGDNNSFDRKNGVTPQISNFTVLGNGDYFQTEDTSSAIYSWSGGAPTDSQPGTQTQVYFQGLTNGFSITVPADPNSVRTLNLYVGHGLATTEIRAHLNESGPWVSVLSTYDNYDETLYSFDFEGAAPGDTLVITGQVVQDFGYGYIDLESAEVIDQNPPVISSVSPSFGGPGTSIEITGSNFGTDQSVGAVLLNGSPLTITSWSDTQIVATVGPTGGAGPLVVSRGLANSNSFDFVPNNGSLRRYLGPAQSDPAVEVYGRNWLVGSSLFSTRQLLTGIDWPSWLQWGSKTTVDRSLSADSRRPTLVRRAISRKADPLGIPKKTLEQNQSNAQQGVMDAGGQEFK